MKKKLMHFAKLKGKIMKVKGKRMIGNIGP